MKTIKTNGEVVSVEERAFICSLLLAGKGYKEISKEIDLSKAQIQHINWKYLKVNLTDAFKARIAREGMPFKTPEYEDSFGYWFSGIFDGEGSFMFSMPRGLIGAGKGTDWYGIRVTLTMRADNSDCVSRIHKTLNVGACYVDRFDRNKQSRNARRQTTWTCGSISEICEVLIPVFDKYSFYSKKIIEYPLWRDAALIIYKNTRGGDSSGKYGFTYSKEELDKLFFISEEIHHLRLWDEGLLEKADGL